MCNTYPCQIHRVCSVLKSTTRDCCIWATMFVIVFTRLPYCNVDDHRVTVVADDLAARHSHASSTCTTGKKGVCVACILRASFATFDSSLSACCASIVESFSQLSLSVRHISSSAPRLEFLKQSVDSYICLGCAQAPRVKYEWPGTGRSIHFSHAAL